MTKIIYLSQGHYMTAWTYIDGEWIEGNPPIMGPLTHAAWLASTVFDGARAFDGVAPDLDLHCARLMDSAATMGLAPKVQAGEMLELTQDGLRHFPKDAALYIRPMFWAEEGGVAFVPPKPESTRFCLCIHDSPLPEPGNFSVTLSSFRRPTVEQAPVDAKCACLYPNSARALREATAKGFDNALVLDALGNVAELATANIWMAKNGVAYTPSANGTFLNGITRQRVIKLLRDSGTKVEERSLHYRDFLDADEVFSTGNYGKVMPITRFENRDLQPGPIYARARELYWSWSHGG